MKKVFLLLLIVVVTVTVKAQTKSGPVAKQMADSICNCLTRVDVSKVTTKEQAVTVYTDCITQHSNILIALAEEKNVDIQDMAAMQSVGVDLAKDMMKQNCQSYMKLSVLMVKGKTADNNTGGVTEGKIKRIDNKGFNYLIITDLQGQEKSFLWLRQFAGSEKFSGLPATYAGKKVTIKWQEIEVYLPQAKGYYKVKEITGVQAL
jgi:hypothetical protein